MELCGILGQTVPSRDVQEILTSSLVKLLQLPLLLLIAATFVGHSAAADEGTQTTRVTTKATTTSTSTSTFTPTPVTPTINICSNVVNNLFLPHISNCSEYYLCYNGYAVPYACQNGYFFDAGAQACLDKSEAKCLPTCPQQRLTSFCYDRTCTKYVLCFAGQPVLRECCDGLQYNADTDRCDYPQYVDCVDNLCNRYNNVNDITYIASKASCDKYYVCVSGQPQNQTCASGLQYNPSCECCDFPSRSNCTVEALQRNIQSFARAPPRRADITCPDEGSQFFAHKSRSDAYYYCLNGRGVTLDCTPGLVYDAQQEECREPQFVGA